MAWAKEKLSDLEIRNAISKPLLGQKKLSDGKGLQLWLTSTGGRYWRFDYTFQGKRKLLSLGVYPNMSLARARTEVDKARQQLLDGVDPSEMKKQLKNAALWASENTFDKLSQKLVEKKQREGRAAVTISKMEWILGKLSHSLGGRPITSIKVPEIIKELQKEESAGNLETARRMRTVIGEVFRFAIQNGLIEYDPVQATRGITAAPKPRHHSAILEPKRVGELLRLIDTYAERNRITGSGLQLMALLYPRPGELRQALWQEFDLENGIWNIPPERMKMRQPHAKSLSTQAVSILKNLKSITGPHGNVFPAVGKSDNHMSENTMNIALRRIGISGEEHCSHGFRATASTLLNASNLFSIDAIERSLAHQDNNAVRRAYARDGSEVERKRMAQWWADHLDLLRANAGEISNVVPIATARSIL
jgi:integrase